MSPRVAVFLLTSILGAAIGAVPTAASALPAPAPLAPNVPVAPLAATKATLERTVMFDGTVHTLAYRGETIYLGGDFTHAVDREGRSVARTRLAAVDARTGQLLAWSPRADAAVRTLVAGSRGVYIGGDFATVNGLPRDSLAQLDPVTGAVTALRHNIYGHPHALALSADRLYMGGTLTSVDGQSRKRLAAFDTTTGALDPAWHPAAQSTVEALAVTGDRVYVGGSFSNINGVKDTAHLAVVDTRGAVRTAFRSTMVYTVLGLTLFQSDLYAAVAGRGGRVVAMDAAGGAVRWTVTTDGDVRSVVRVHDTLYAGGHFDRVCSSNRVGDKGVCRDGSTPRIKMAAIDLGGRLLPWLADANGVVGVETLAASAGLGKFAAGGAFTEINGAPQRRFAQFRP